MAKQIIHKLLDDLDGGDADETVKFSLDGINYEIDLSAKNAKKLREVFAEYVSAGSKLGRGVFFGSHNRASSPTPTAAALREENRTIRAWALRNEIPINERGRIPNEVVEQYKDPVRRRAAEEAYAERQARTAQAAAPAKSAPAAKATKSAPRKAAPAAKSARPVKSAAFSG